MAKFTFEATAKEVSINDVPSVAAWTDGISLSSDSDRFCAYRLQPGTRYKVTVELAEDQR